MFKKRAVKKIRIINNDEENGSNNAIHASSNITNNSKVSAIRVNHDSNEEEDLVPKTAFLKKGQRKNIPIFQKDLPKKPVTEQYKEYSTAEAQADTITYQKQNSPSASISVVSTEHETDTPKILNMDDLDDLDEAVILNEEQQENKNERQLNQQSSIRSPNLKSSKEYLKEENEYVKLLNQDDLEELNSIYKRGKKDSRVQDTSHRTNLQGNENSSDGEADYDLQLNEPFINEGNIPSLAITDHQKQMELLQRKKYIMGQLSMNQDDIVQLPVLKPVTHQSCTTPNFVTQLQDLRASLSKEIRAIQEDLAQNYQDSLG